MKLNNKKTQAVSSTLLDNIVEYLPWIILFGVLIIAVFLLRDKLGIT